MGERKGQTAMEREEEKRGGGSVSKLFLHVPITLS